MGVTSGVTAGITSGGSDGGEWAPTFGMTALLPATSLGVDTRLLSYVSSVTWTEKEVLEGEVSEHDSQEQVV